MPFLKELLPEAIFEKSSTDFDVSPGSIVKVTGGTGNETIRDGIRRLHIRNRDWFSFVAGNDDFIIENEQKLGSRTNVYRQYPQKRYLFSVKQNSVDRIDGMPGVNLKNSQGKIIGRIYHRR